MSGPKFPFALSHHTENRPTGADPDSCGNRHGFTGFLTRWTSGFVWSSTERDSVRPEAGWATPRRRAPDVGGVETVYARAHSGFYYWEAVESYEKHHCRFIISARKTARLVEGLKGSAWQPSPHLCRRAMQISLSTGGRSQAYRFVATALREGEEAQARTGRAVSTKISHIQ
jgi:hypothetical protein